MMKAIAWSYPSSTNAKRFGFYKEGCWTVELIDVVKLPVAEAGFASLDEAREYASHIPLEYHKYSY